MSDIHPMKLISPYDVQRPEGDFPFDFYGARVLAQGDSWFSLGALPPTSTTNLLTEIRLSRQVACVNCARPGKVLSHMTSTSTEAMFLLMLKDWPWDIILLSGFGNDAIDALSVAPAAPAGLRLLATPAERGVVNGPDDYFSPTGWQTFVDHMGEVFENFLQRRDETNAQAPLVLHNYHTLTPRFAGAGAGFGPWIAPALQAFNVPLSDWQPVADTLMKRVDALLRAQITKGRLAHPLGKILLVDTQAVPMDLSDPASTGVSGDFANEIHPTRSGYKKLAPAFGPVLEPLLPP